MTPSYSWFIDRFGPLPTFSDVADYLGLHYTQITPMVRKGELEAVTTSAGRRRIVLNSLVAYLDRSPAEAGKAAVPFVIKVPKTRPPRFVTSATPAGGAK